MKIKNILVSQPQPTDFEKSPYGEIARKFNVNITFRKFFMIEGIPARDFRKDRINILDYSAVIFTSRNAVDHFFRISKEMRVEVPETMKYFSISESTAYYLQKYVQFRKRKIFHSKENYANLIELIKKHKTDKFLLPCSDIHKQEIPKMLEENKIQYKKAIIYKTLASDLSDIDINHYDLLIFFSPSGIKSLFKNFPDFVQGEIAIGAFGNSTHKAVRDAGLNLNVEAPTQNAPSMTLAIEQFLQAEARKK
ncbi:MAG: uroporphyrinogen-III synthase [Bacteroidales bacterium]|nr:uroporphyrinogen-III synthase [Bacteroidales bacterium]HNW72229.1 uroporphyrinogen-III synthase [Bacteroidales bacterium]HPS49298.1 uroporphyrinogen-III synthase [Bacteroidales bacterium]